MEAMELSIEAPEIVEAPRRLPFEGAANFRDLGGYPTEPGGQTRWGTVYRADALHRFSPADLDAFAELGCRTVIDLRGDSEREQYPDPVPSVHLPLITRRPDDADEARAALARFRDAASGESALRELYGRILADGHEILGRIFTALAEPGALPAVFHCTAGKDRTGLSAALLLELLEVPRSVVLDDFELTAMYWHPQVNSEPLENLVALGMGPEAAAALMGAPRWTMKETLDELDEVYGGVEAYLTGNAGVSPEALGRLRSELVA
jgi:protein-tyrosine phosphatase